MILLYAADSLESYDNYNNDHQHISHLHPRASMSFIKIKSASPSPTIS